jgi:hypothetical protein
MIVLGSKNPLDLAGDALKDMKDKIPIPSPFLAQQMAEAGVEFKQEDLNAIGLSKLCSQFDAEFMPMCKTSDSASLVQESLY